MNKPNTTMARQIAQAASDFELETTGHPPKSVTVVLSDSTLMIALHGSLSPAEQALAKSPEGAAKVQQFHRQLFSTASKSLQQKITRITGVAVRESNAEVETTDGTVIKVFTTGTVVHVFLHAGEVPAEAWSGRIPSDPSGGIPSEAVVVSDSRDSF
jgi:uncharacterized protein YbcI